MASAAASIFRDMARTGVAAALLATLSTPALSGEDRRCGHLMPSDWPSEAEMRARIEELGYRVEAKRFAIDDGCVSARVSDAEGAVYELRLHPKTGRVVERRRIE